MERHLSSFGLSITGMAIFYRTSFGESWSVEERMLCPGGVRLFWIRKSLIRLNQASPKRER